MKTIPPLLETQTPAQQLGTAERAGLSTVPAKGKPMETILRLQSTIGNQGVLRMMAANSAGIRTTVAGRQTIYRKPQGSVQQKAANAQYAPVLSANTSALTIDSDQTAEVEFRVDNLKEAGGMKVDLGGGTGNSEIVEFVGLKSDTRHGKATMTVRGKRSGSALISATAEAADGERKTLWLPVTVSSDAARAAASLRSIDERRKRGEKIEGAEEDLAEKKAVAGAEKVASKAKGSHGTEIAAVISNIRDEITRIEAARARGYLQAVSDLSAKGLDKQADYGPFVQALAGNLLWALSGVLPAAPLGVLIAGETLEAFFKAKWTAPGPGWAAAVGTVGAMIAQFSSLPGDATSSTLKIALENGLTSANAAICNSLRRSAYEFLADAVATSMPESTTDAREYAADLQMGLRYALYGDLFAKGLNDGAQPDAGKIQIEARGQLLRQYVVGSTALSGDDLTATKARSDSVDVEGAVALLGGKENLKLEPYELIVNQIRAAAADMGCEINMDPKAAAQYLTAGRDIAVPVSNFNYRSLFGLLPNKWMQMIADDKIIKLEPQFDNEVYMAWSPDIQKMNNLTVLQKDLVSADIQGKKVYSANYVHFSATGGGKQKGFVNVDVPQSLDIRYRIAPVTSHEKWWGGEP